jgi:preprotein translocase subunit SecE
MHKCVLTVARGLIGNGGPLLCVCNSPSLGRNLIGDETMAGTTETKKKKENRLVRYFIQTRAELRKVTWPTRKEATRLTAIVLAVTLAMAAFLGLIDYLFTVVFALII